MVEERYVGFQVFSLVSRPAVCRYAGAHGREGFQPFPPYNFFSVFLRVLADKKEDEGW